MGDNKTQDTVDEKNLEQRDQDLIRKLAYQQVHRLTVTICILIILSYILGYFQLTVLVPVLLCVYAVWVWKLKTNDIMDWFYREHEMREHRKRALENAETVEWLNFLLNRWWFFSDETINNMLKKGIDPVLESCKPKMIKSIELEHFTLGNRTPYFKYLKVYDLTEDQRKQAASEVIYRNPPIDLPVRPKYQVAIDCDMALDAPESKLVIRVMLDSRLGFTDVVVDKFKIRGRLQIILSFNQNIPFPHLAAFSISFLQEPLVNFDIRLLKKIQLMEFPLIREWISELVNDSLKVTLVDPGHLTIPLCNDPELMGRQSGYCSGVLTLTIKGGSRGKATNDEQWCTVTLDKQKIRTKEITADVLWQDQVSLLVYSLQYDKLRIKIKGKRRFGPNYTVVEYILPLMRLNLEQNCEQKMELCDENIEGSYLQLHFNYSSLPVLEASNEVDEETFNKNYIERNAIDEPTDVSGILFVCVHKGTNLIPMDSNGLSDPYVMTFANKDLVQMGHVIEETLNPEWDAKSEFFTLDYTQTTLSFVVHDRNAMVLPTVLLADDNDDFMGSCNMRLTKDDWCVFKKDIDLLFKFHGDSKKGRPQTTKKVGKLTVSVIFRPISSIKNSIQGTPNAWLTEGEPLHQKRTKIDAVTMEAILCGERGSVTICILRAKNLVALDLNGRSDPFVIIRVGDLKQEKFKTKVVYRTLNPVWNEQVTFAMPQKHERVSVEVWDKDPFTQEKMGVVRFAYDDLANLGASGLNEKHWFDLEQAKSGEIQLGFQAKLPEVAKNIQMDRLDDAVDGNQHIIESYSYGSGSDEGRGRRSSTKKVAFSLRTSADFLILDHQRRSPKPNGHLADGKGEKKGSTGPVSVVVFPNYSGVANGGDSDEPPRSPNSDINLSPYSDIESNQDAASEEKESFVDFSGGPSKYYGLHGSVLELIGLSVNREEIDEVYVKIKLDTTAKFQKPLRRSLISRHERMLCRTENFRVDERMAINETFQMKSDVGVSPCIFLLLEVKSDKKGKDIIDSHSMLLRNFFKGETSATRIIELDNGGKMKLQLSHIRQTSNTNTVKKRYSFRKHSKYQLSVDHTNDNFRKISQ